MGADRKKKETDEVGSSGSSINSVDKHSSKVDTKGVDKDDLQDDEPPQFRLSDYIYRRNKRPPVDPDAIATRRSVYDDAVLAKHYWPKPEYENIHRFDPTARWTFREEKDLLRKIDWRVMLWAAISFSALNLDRGNLTHANSDNFLPDLGLTTDDFNLGNSVFRLAFLCAELPSQLISKRLGPDRWIPIQMCIWAIVTGGQFFLSGRTSFLATRALLGGLITLIVGIATFFRMPPSPTQTKTWFRPNGWFNEREETIAVSRVLRDDPTKGDMHNREGLSIQRIWKAVCDYDLWPLYIAGLMFAIPVTPPQTYLSLSLRSLGFDTFQTNLLGIPASVLSIINMFAITLVSETVNERSFVAMTEDVWALPFLVALYTLPDKPNQWKFYVAWCSRNSGAVASRTVNASVYNMFVQASSIIAAQVYRKDDAPMYRRGNAVLIGICCFNIAIMYPSIKLYYVWRNKQRAKIWDAMTSESYQFIDPFKIRLAIWKTLSGLFGARQKLRARSAMPALPQPCWDTSFVPIL
ncbi:hypothetical protein DXG01_014392 [Tephrocybe rancida]|nr:hypothetical protein DXG01_014392 [Tephrocybe rancida]